MKVTSFVLGMAGFAALVGCGSGGADLEDVKKGQKDILAKLENIEKTVQQLKAAPAQAAARPALDPNKVYDIAIGSSPVRGPRAAKVTIAEFADFQCPFCAQSATLVDQVLKLYPNDVNFIYKNFPLPPTMHPNAMPAAKASVAASRQGKFWEMHDIMFQNSRELTFDKLKEYAGKIGLDVARWEKDYNAPETQQEVEKDMTAGRSADVSGTPTFFVNGKRATNRSVDGFKDMIEAAMKGSDKKG